MGREVWAFFYGSFMHAEVVAQRGVALGPAEVATLPGYAIRMQPLSNVVPEEGGAVFGLLARLSHADLGRLYARLPDAAGTGSPPEDAAAAYLPEAVLVQARSGAWRAALCYLAPPAAARPAGEAYLGHILDVAREHHFPEWYIRRLLEARA